MCFEHSICWRDTQSTPVFCLFLHFYFWFFSQRCFFNLCPDSILFPSSYPSQETWISLHGPNWHSSIPSMKGEVFSVSVGKSLSRVSIILNQHWLLWMPVPCLSVALQKGAMKHVLICIAGKGNDGFCVWLPPFPLSIQGSWCKTATWNLWKLWQVGIVFLHPFKWPSPCVAFHPLGRRPRRVVSPMLSRTT